MPEMSDRNPDADRALAELRDSINFMPAIKDVEDISAVASQYEDVINKAILLCRCVPHYGDDLGKAIQTLKYLLDAK